MDLSKLALLVLCCLPICVVHARTDQEILDQFKVKFMECNKNVGIVLPSIDNMTELIKQSSVFNKQCWRKCYLQSVGLEKADGKLNVDFAVDHVIKLAGPNKYVVDKAKDIVDACTTMKVKDDPCIAGVQYMNCLSKNIDRLTILSYLKALLLREKRKYLTGQNGDQPMPQQPPMANPPGLPMGGFMQNQWGGGYGPAAMHPGMMVGFGPQSQGMRA